MDLYEIKTNCTDLYNKPSNLRFNKLSQDMRIKNVRNQAMNTLKLIQSNSYNPSRNEIIEKEVLYLQDQLREVMLNKHKLNKHKLNKHKLSESFNEIHNYKHNEICEKSPYLDWMNARPRACRAILQQLNSKK